MALSSGILSAGFCYSHQIENWLWYGILTFLSTLAVYNGQRLFKAKSKFKTPWLSWVNDNQKTIASGTIISLGCAGLIILKIWNFNWLSFILLSVSTIISILYVVKIKGRNMRELPYLKIHLIALTWTAVIIGFPIINEELTVENSIVLLAHYCYVLAVTIPFDIRDLKYDDKRHKTIPQTIGIRASKASSLVLLIMFSLLMVSVENRLKTNGLFYVGILVQMLLVGFMNEKRSDIYCAGLIDGAIALVGLSYFLL